MDVGEFFFQQGLLGVIILVLAGVVLWQQRRIDDKDKQIIELQNKRKMDADGYTLSYITTTKEMVGTQINSLNAINLLQKSVESLSVALDRIADKGNI